MAHTRNRGFASMDGSKQRDIASKGGKAAHARGTAHEFTSEEARVAGRKGGEIVSANRTHMAEIGRKGGEAVSSDRSHMAAIGREGGRSSHGAVSKNTYKDGSAVGDDQE
jgi:general stress protein YciG